jgi:serine protease Do
MRVERGSPFREWKLECSGRDGALIAEAVPNGPAARAGFRPGDVVVALQGRPIRRADGLPRATARAPVGSDVELKLLRDGKEQAVTVRLGELPEPQG